MCAGDQVPGSAGGEFAAPADTGEAVGTSASNLTITVGYGPGLFSTRNGLAGKGPAHLAELPPLPHETLQPAYGGGAVVVQACADDPQVAFHAVRNLSRIASGPWPCVGSSRGSGARRPPPPARRPSATSWASRTAPAT